MATNVKFKKIITQLSKVMHELNQEDNIELRFSISEDMLYLYNVETNEIIEKIKAPMNMYAIE